MKLAGKVALVTGASRGTGEHTAYQDVGASTTTYGSSKAALHRVTVGLARELRGSGVAVNALEVSAVTDAVRLDLPHADFSRNELPEAPAQLVTWIAAQDPGSRGHPVAERPLDASV